MEFRILGPLEVWERGAPIELRQRRHRALLAALLLRAGEIVSVDQLLDDLWGERPPPTAKGSLQNAVSALRKLLGAKLLRTQTPGYLLDVKRERVDLFRFERLLDEARSTRGEAERAEKLRQALDLWRGPPLADLAFEPFVLLEAHRLDELRLVAQEDLIDARLTVGEQAELVPELETLVAEHPFNERLRGQLMLALYRVGRQTEALEFYRKARRLLDDELGLEPGQELRELEQAILRQDPRLTPAPTFPLDLLPARKTATVLYADLARLGQLDPEVLDGLLDRYSAVARQALELHGGTVEMLPSGAVMAFFGVPRAHEDDCLRALRAAVNLGTDFDALGGELEARIGISTGEVFASAARSTGLATGSVVDSVRRLAGAAAAGEVLLGAGTVRLVHDAVKLAPFSGPLGVDGQLAAWRLLELIEDSPAIPRRFEAALVGRSQELAELCMAFDHARTDRRSRLLIVVGEPGIGKTRLAREFLAGIAEEATVLVGRCPSYGEGATLLPMLEILREAGLETREALSSFLSTEQDGWLVAHRIAGSIGLTEEPAPLEETNWAVRRLFEALAARRPLVLVFEDVHWAEPTLLDLVEQLAERASGPILVLCLTRPELLERRTGWAQRELTLGPLREAEVAKLVDALQVDLRPAGRARVIELAEGNPLFAEQLVAHAREEGPESLDLAPPSIEALLASRLDVLSREERRLLQAAAVIGRRFLRGAAVKLAEEDVAAAEASLRSLTEKGLIGTGADSDALAFHHVLVRNVAYAGTPKRTRADLHERFATWLEERGADLVELDEILGFHLEQACRYRRELELPDDTTLALAARDRLHGAADRAMLRADGPAAVSFLQRAIALVPPGEISVDLEFDLVDALNAIGRTDESLRRARSITDRASAVGDRAGELWGRLAEGTCRWRADPEGGAQELTALVDEVLPEFEARADHFALFAAYLLRGEIANARGRMDESLEALELAVDHARQAGLQQRDCLTLRANALLNGTTPVSKALAWIEDQEARGVRRVPLRIHKAEALAMVGRVDEARALLAEAHAELADRGGGGRLAMALSWSAHVEFLAGDFAAAAALGQEACNLFDEVGERSVQSTSAGWVAKSLYELDRLDEADEWAGLAAELGASDDPHTQMLWRQVRAKVLARRGDYDEAERLAREAVAVGEQTDCIAARGEAYADLGEVLLVADRAPEAAEAFQQALACFERKGCIVLADRVREWVAALPGQAARLSSARPTTPSRR